MLNSVVMFVDILLVVGVNVFVVGIVVVVFVVLMVEWMVVKFVVVVSNVFGFVIINDIVYFLLICDNLVVLELLMCMVGILYCDFLFLVGVFVRFVVV